MVYNLSSEPPLDPSDVDYPEETEDDADNRERALSRIEDEDKARRKGIR